MFNTIKQTCQNYYDELPQDTLKTVFKSGLYSFVNVSVFKSRSIFLKNGDSYNVANPLFHAGVAALASLIYALATPLFNRIFGDNHKVFHREFIRQVVNLSVVSVLVTYMTTSKVNLAANIFFLALSINMFKAQLNLIPQSLDWVHPQAANEVRRIYGWIGFNAEPGSGSIFLAP